MVKLVVVGPSGVGKTVLTHFFYGGNLDYPTQGCQYHRWYEKYTNVYDMIIYDIAGDFKYRGLGMHRYGRNAVGAVLVVDINDTNLINTIRTWDARLARDLPKVEDVAVWINTWGFDEPWPGYFNERAQGVFEAIKTMGIFIGDTKSPQQNPFQWLYERTFMDI